MKKLLIVLLLAVFLAGCAQKDIPFFKQTDSGNCLQTNLKIALKYYYPEKDYSFEELDNMTGRTAGRWTWTSQALKFLVDQELDAYYYSTTPYKQILENGESFILGYYGESDGSIMVQHTDFDSLYRSIETLENTGRYENKKLDFSEVEDEFKKGSLIIMLIDRAALTDPDLPYTGHFVTITGINETHVIFHDTGGTPDRMIDRQTFISAWDAAGTDNDVIIIKGKI